MIQFAEAHVEGGIVDRNLVWTSVHGIKTKLVDMDDTYLANLYDYLGDRCHYLEDNEIEEILSGEHDLDDSFLPFPVKVMAVIRELQKERGLKDEFMKRAQIPYKNPRGKWEIWDFKVHRPIELEEEKATV